LLKFDVLFLAAVCMYRLENLLVCKQDLALCHDQIRRSQIHSVWFYAMKRDLREIIVRAFERGERQADIFRRFEPDGISQQYISYTIKRWRETGSVEDRPHSGGPRTARTPQLIRKIRQRICKNRRRSARKLAAKLHTSRRTIQRLLKDDLGLKPYKRQKVHGLSIAQKEKRLLRCKRLLRRFPKSRAKSIVFSDEKIFTVEEKLNSQNDRIYAAAIEDIPEEIRTVQRFQSPGSFMVWAAISTQGKFALTFVKPGVKVDKAYYQREILQKIVKPEGKRIFKNEQWTFQQDSAPAHSAKINQTWCKVNLPDFISSSEWPPSSPDLNPLDYCIWGVLEARVNATQHRSLNELKRAVRREWKKLPMGVVRSVIDLWRPRLRACKKANGGRFK
jgi:inhibitor of nuclear factor kappa-B kinase subunit alpha